MKVIAHTQKAIKRNPDLAGLFYVEVDPKTVAKRHLPEDLKPNEIVAWKCRLENGQAWHPSLGWLPLAKFVADGTRAPMGKSDSCFPTAVFRMDSFYRRTTLEQLTA